LEVLRERASAAARAEELKRKKVERANLSSSEQQSDLNTKVFLKPTREQVDEQWARALIKKGLAIDLVDDKEFRAAVLATARAGLSYVDAAADVADSCLPHRFKMTKSVIPKLDDSLDERVGKKIEGITKETGKFFISLFKLALELV